MPALPLHSKITILECKTQLPNSIFKPGFDRQRVQLSGTYSVPSFPGDFEKLTDTRPDGTARAHVTTLSIRTQRVDSKRGIGKESCSDLSAFRGIDPVMGNDQIEVLLQEQLHRFAQRELHELR